eukprot:316440-Alexandrium_andersonii.AAC.1
MGSTAWCIVRPAGNTQDQRQGSTMSVRRWDPSGRNCSWRHARCGEGRTGGCLLYTSDAADDM